MAAAAAVGFAGCALVAWCGPVDRPGARTSHAAPTPTSGGLALMAATCAAVLIFSLACRVPVGRGPLVALTAATALAALGCVDDLYDLPALLKLAVMTAAAALVALTAAGPLGPLTALLGFAWIVAAMNAVNFMDGADGLVPGALGLACAALAAAAAAQGRPGVAAAAAALAGAQAGLLPWNLGGRLFQGDAGSLFCGFAYAALAVWGPGPLFAALAALPLLADVGLTLLRRLRARRPLLRAHREHLYQRWLQATGASHAALCGRVAALTAGTSALAVVCAPAAPGLQLAVLAGASLAAAGGWSVVSRRVDDRLLRRGDAAA